MKGTLFLYLFLARLAAAQSYDLLIKGGHIIDAANQIVVPTLGAVLPARPGPPVVVTPLPVVSAPQAAVEIQAPQPGDSVTRTFIMQLLAPSANDNKTGGQS